MPKWELITEVKDSGYYIGWKRANKEIHMPKPMTPMSKTSLVQIGGNNKDGYAIRGMVVAHSIFPSDKYGIGHQGLRLFDKTIYRRTLPHAQIIATVLKREIVKQFDTVTKTDINDKLLRKEYYAK